MVLNISISEDEWKLVNVVKFNFETFKVFIRNVIIQHIKKYEDIDQAVITIPANTTRSQRFSIHYVSSKNNINRDTYLDKNGNTIMVVTVEKEFIQSLMNDYMFNK